MPSPADSLHYFIHVPKTAGTTVRRWLADSFERDEILFIYPGQIPEAPDAHAYSFEYVAREHHRLLPSFRVFFGHYKFNSDWFVRPDCRGLGFVREPRARVVSHYRYLERQAARLPGMEHIARAIQEDGAGIRELYERLEYIEFDNAIVRYFTAAEEPIGEISERHVERAIDNVERHFDFVGHVDWFDYSMRRIAEALGRPYAAAAAQNVSPGTASPRVIGDCGVDFLDSITRHDRAFVDYIEAKFFAGIPKDSDLAAPTPRRSRSATELRSGGRSQRTPPDAAGEQS